MVAPVLGGCAPVLAGGRVPRPDAFRHAFRHATFRSRLFRTGRKRAIYRTFYIPSTFQNSVSALLHLLTFSLVSATLLFVAHPPLWGLVPEWMVQRPRRVGALPILLLLQYTLIQTQSYPAFFLLGPPPLLLLLSMRIVIDQLTFRSCGPLTSVAIAGNCQPDRLPWVRKLIGRRRI